MLITFEPVDLSHIHSNQPQVNALQSEHMNLTV
jgi:hypothetical protein